MPGKVPIGVNLLSVSASKWTAYQYIEYLAKLDVQMAQCNPSVLGAVTASDEEMKKFRAFAEERGVSLLYLHGAICPTSSGFNTKLGTLEQQLDRGLHISRMLGGAAIKVAIGGERERAGIERHMESTLRALKPLRSKILDSGVKLALENHGDMQARELKAFVEEAGKDIVGVLLDSANPPFFLIEDPHLSLEILAPYTVMSHVRDTALWRVPQGVAAQWVNMGEGNVDIAGWVRKFVEKCPGQSVSIENIISPAPRVSPVFEPEIWKSFSKTPAAEFSRFLALAQRGNPVPAPTVVEPAKRGEQQRGDLEVSLRFLRQALKA